MWSTRVASQAVANRKSSADRASGARIDELLQPRLVARHTLETIELLPLKPAALRGRASAASAAALPPPLPSCSRCRLQRRAHAHDCTDGRMQARLSRCAQSRFARPGKWADDSRRCESINVRCACRRYCPTFSGASSGVSSSESGEAGAGRGGGRVRPALDGRVGAARWACGAGVSALGAIAAAGARAAAAFAAAVTAEKRPFLDADPGRLPCAAWAAQRIRPSGRSVLIVVPFCSASVRRLSASISARCGSAADV